MQTRSENLAWYAEWSEVVERVVAARMVCDSLAPGTPKRVAADREYHIALAAFRSAAERFRPAT
jgi:hypothetical protein